MYRKCTDQHVEGNFYTIVTGCNLTIVKNILVAIQNTQCIGMSRKIDRYNSCPECSWSLTLEMALTKREKDSLDWR